MKAITLFILITVLWSCSEENKTKEQPEKDSEEVTMSPTEYANKYCECMKSNPDNLSICEEILNEVIEEFGQNNKEAEKEFSDAMSECLR